MSKLEHYKYKCDRCDAVYCVQGYLENHVKQPHDGKRHQCRSCKKEFISKNALHWHRQQWHTSGRVKKSSTRVQNHNPAPVQYFKLEPVKVATAAPTQNGNPEYLQINIQAPAQFVTQNVNPASIQISNQAPAQFVTQNVNPAPIQMSNQAPAQTGNQGNNWIMNFLAGLPNPIHEVDAATLEKMNTDLIFFQNHPELTAALKTFHDYLSEII